MPVATSPGDVFLDVFDEAPRRELAPGDVLIHAGEPATDVFNVIDGMVMISRFGRDGRRQVLGFLFPDDFVGLTATETYFFTVEAVTPTVIASRGREFLDQRLAGDPVAEQAFIAMVFRVMENLVDLAYSLGQRTARERLAVFVLYLRHRYRLSTGTPDDDRQLLTLELPMSRTDIADFVGLKKETVSRSFGQLESAGLIERAGSHRLRILDIAGLRELAGVVDFSSPARLAPGRRNGARQ
ncbi:MAG: Crp/Fnr family transcriptional regulator [Chromatiales bacterium]|nr:MAG: Crp/Fnr family transcriptional regulator [Chromatiales bacterium]